MDTLAEGTGTLQVSFKSTLDLCGQPVRSMEEALEVMKTLAPEEVYPAALRIQDHAHSFLSEAVKSLEKLHDFIEQGEFWREHEENVEAFHDSWKITRDAVRSQQGVARFNDNLLLRAKTQWGEGQANALFLRIKGDTMKRKISKFLTSGISYEHTRASINNAYVARRSTRKRGIRQESRIMQADLTNAFLSQDTTPLDHSVLQGLELGIDIDGFVCPSIGLVSEAPTTQPPTPKKQQKNSCQEEDDDDEEEEGHSSSQAKDKEDHNNSSSGNSNDENGDSDSNSNSDSNSDGDSEGSGDADDDFQPHPRKRAKHTTPPMSTCGCPLTKAALQRLIPAKKNVVLPTDTLKKQALRKIGRETSSPNESHTLRLCPEHTHALCRQLGIYHRFAITQAHRRLLYLYKKLDSWDSVRQQHPSWFKGSIGNLQSGWRFEATALPLRPKVSKPTQMSSFTFMKLYKRCFGKAPPPEAMHMDQQMKKDGSVVVTGLFSWLTEDLDGQHPGGILPMILQEFDMYDWHYRARPGKPRIGWARNMWFSLVQQLVRQDPAYYAFYVFFRPDHAWRLISFPYYTKSTYPGESTFFRHIDVNIADFVRTGRGQNALQGSLALSVEDDNNCTEMLLGMHRDIREWNDRLRLRGYTKDGYVQQIQPTMWTKDDEDHFGYTWSKQKCTIGDVRLSLPGLPHGSTGPATSRRLNILPWFVGIGEDHQTLDVAESGTWGDLSHCHRSFYSGTKTPSGLPNSTFGGRMDQIFPATVRLGRLGAISDALVGQVRWDEVDVREELDILFGDDDVAAWGFIQRWRKHAQQLYIAAFEKLVLTERAAFGANSFFERTQLGLDVTPVFIKGGFYWSRFQDEHEHEHEHEHEE
ncbi:uncharacterized protein N7483_001742 [Penicillium malachiteum]|uniref:uncharacterized protein n=1 Tax=Penicillium malachiteum TaxID=1324776 RepID=UPI002548E6F5|nr:uncharacterized protein N7483_001742 [Penicillium malachiteum]KAJ5736617.1 hypothetical protein N7483_001742 [Penicillium malachiteum]